MYEYGANWNVEPRTGTGNQNQEPGTGNQELLYIRLHGRNAAAWWDHEESEDRYNYLYSPTELEPVAETARAASERKRRVLLYMNNHFSAKSVANAAILKHKLGQDLEGEYPEEFVERYPDLKGKVKVLPSLIPSRKPS